MLNCKRYTRCGIGAGRGNRTLVFSLEGCCSTIELYPRAASGNTSRGGSQPHVRSHPLPAATGGLRLDFKEMTCGHGMSGCRPAVNAGPPSLSFRGRTDREAGRTEPGIPECLALNMLGFRARSRRLRRRSRPGMTSVGQSNIFSYLPLTTSLP